MREIHSSNQAIVQSTTSDTKSGWQQGHECNPTLVHEGLGHDRLDKLNTCVRRYSVCQPASCIETATSPARVKSKTTHIKLIFSVAAPFRLIPILRQNLRTDKRCIDNTVSTKRAKRTNQIASDMSQKLHRVDGITAQKTQVTYSILRPFYTTYMLPKYPQPNHLRAWSGNKLSQYQRTKSALSKRHASPMTENKFTNLSDEVSNLPRLNVLLTTGGNNPVGNPCDHMTDRIGQFFVVEWIARNVSTVKKICYIASSTATVQKKTLKNLPEIYWRTSYCVISKRQLQNQNHRLEHNFQT